MILSILKLHLHMRNLSVENILVRKLEAEDAEDISRIYAAITQTSVESDFKQIIEKQALLKDGDASFVAEYQGRVVGYMISSSPSGGFGIERSAWITMLGVNPKFMGQGIGKKMAEEVFRFYDAKGIRNIYTTVRWHYGDLLSFFKTLGFDRSDFVNLRKAL